jgi:hypothetical protein
MSQHVTRMHENNGDKEKTPHPRRSDATSPRVGIVIYTSVV